MSGFDVRTADATRSRALTILGTATLGLVVVGGAMVTRTTGQTEARAEAPTPYEIEAARQDRVLADADAPLGFERLVEAQQSVFTACADCPAIGAVEVSVRPGQTFASVLSAAGISGQDAHRAVQSMEDVFPARRLRAGQVINVFFETPLLRNASTGGENRRLTGLSFRPDSERTVTVARSGETDFRTVEALAAFETEHVRVSGEISSSLYAAALNAGATDRIVTSMANILGYNIDFRTIQRGDMFDVVYERRVNDRGEVSRTGDIAYVAFETGGKMVEYFRHDTEDGPGYYTEEGESAQRLLMKTPIDGARISSNFGRRFHPIHQTSRAHNGTDFAAPTGTPIYASGNGVVERADWFSSFGNYVRIRHANGYKTAYAHLNGFASGLGAGDRVSQGEVIGYVGTTGASTGPHLHYEVHLNGNPTDPMGLDLPTGTKLDGSQLEAFEAQRDRILALRDAAPAPDGGRPSGLRVAANTAR